MPHLQRHVCPLRHGQEIQARPRPHPPVQLPPRRRTTRPLLVDTAALHNRNLPREPSSYATDRDLRLSPYVRQAIPVLGLRRGFPGLDEAQYAAGEQQERVWTVDVRGA